MTMGLVGNFGRVGISFIAVVASLSVAACGGESDSEGSGGTTVSSGIDSQKQVDELEPADSVKFCEATQEAMEEAFVPLLDLTCASVGLSAYIFAESDAVATCEQAVSDCKSGDSGDAPAVEETDCSDEDNQIPSGCTASVGELEECLGDFLDELVAESKKIELPACSGIEEYLKNAAEQEQDSSDVEEQELEPSDVPSCAKLPAVCFE